VRLEAKSVDEIIAKVNLIRTEENYGVDVSRIGKFRRKRCLDGTFKQLPAVTHGIVECSIWNEIPFYHVMRPGMLVPCLSHDIMGGLGRRELSLILIDLCKSNFVDWKFFQANFKILKRNLRYGDKQDFSSKLTGIY